MAKHIEQSDIKNKDLKLLPIRRGCSGLCACMGTCLNIVGYIERVKYDKLINENKLEDFLRNL